MNVLWQHKTQTTLHVDDPMPVEYLPDGTTVHSETPPPKANGIGWNAVLASVTAGVVLAGAAFGISEFFDGAPDMKVDANTLGGVLENKGTITRGAESVVRGAQEFGNDVVQKAGEVTDYVAENSKELLAGIHENITGALGGSSEFSKTLQSLTIPFDPNDPTVQAFRDSQETFQRLPSGDFLVRAHEDARIFALDDDLIRNLTPEQLQKYPDLQTLHQQVMGKQMDIDWAKGGAMMATGGAAGLGLATMAANNKVQPANPNPYTPSVQTGQRVGERGAPSTLLTQPAHQGQVAADHLTRLV
jgi:hypothetical protein